MAIELSNEEKIKVVEQHMKAVAYAKYNAELSLAQENVLYSPNTETVVSLTKQIQDSIAQQQILQDEIDSLS